MVSVMPWLFSTWDTWGKHSTDLWRIGHEGPRAGLAVVARSNSPQPFHNTN